MNKHTKVQQTKTPSFSVVDADGLVVLPGFAGYDAAEKYITDHEQRTGEIPGCDHGFGMGSGWRVQQDI